MRKLTRNIGGYEVGQLTIYSCYAIAKKDKVLSKLFTTVDNMKQRYDTTSTVLKDIKSGVYNVNGEYMYGAQCGEFLVLDLHENVRFKLTLLQKVKSFIRSFRYNDNEDKNTKPKS